MSAAKLRELEDWKAGRLGGHVAVMADLQLRLEMVSSRMA
jgi:hypothetical protein